MVIALGNFRSAITALPVLELPVCFLDILPKGDSYLALVTLLGKVQERDLVLIYKESWPDLASARQDLIQKEAILKGVRPDLALLPGHPIGKPFPETFASFLQEFSIALKELGNRPEQKRPEESEPPSPEEPALSPEEVAKIQEALEKETQELLGQEK